jgi:Na+/melibiose symporter-like transporter
MLVKISLFKHTDLSLLLFGSFTSLIGTLALDFALALYILKTTQSASLFASILAISAIPEILITPFGGVLSDRVNRKKILVYLDILSCVIFALYSIYILITGNLSIILIYILVITQAIISGLFNPCITTIIPSITEKQYLVNANLYNMISKKTANIIAPLLAGCLYGFIGLPGILILNSITFFISAISEIFINIPVMQINKEKILINDLIESSKDGIKFLFNKKKLFYIMLIGSVINFSVTPILSIGFNYLAKINLNVNDIELGLLNSIAVMSAFIVPFIFKIMSKKFNFAKILLKGLILVTISFFIMSLVSSQIYITSFQTNLIPYISLIITSIILSMGCYLASLAITLLMQSETPNYMLGRVNSIMSTFLTCFIPIGQIFFGFLFDNIAPSNCITLAFIILLITIIIYKNIVLNKKEIIIIDNKLSHQ